MTLKTTKRGVLSSLEIGSNSFAERFHHIEMDPYRPLDITNDEIVRDLLRNAPQINPVSTLNGNGQALCGAASIANALILSCKTADQSKMNAQSLRKSVYAFLVPGMTNGSRKTFEMMNEEDTALRRMESGSMSIMDAFHLQQLLYKLGRCTRFGVLSNRNGQGLSPNQIAATVALLRACGAFTGVFMALHCHRLQSGVDHWTTTVDGTHVNSQVGSRNKSAVMGGFPLEANPGHASWRYEISLRPDSTTAAMTIKFRAETDQPPQHQTAQLEITNYDTPARLLEFEKDLLQTMKI